MVEDCGLGVILTEEGMRGRLPSTGARVVSMDGGREEQEEVKAVAENAAYLIYTSGSTGKPKGVVNTHRGICNLLYWMQERYGLGSEDRVLQKTPLSFDVSVWEMFWPLMSGAEVVVARPEGHKDPAYLGEVIVGEQITTIGFVPSMLGIFVEEEGKDLGKSVRRVIATGEELTAELEGRFHEVVRGVELSNLYGPTEAAVEVTGWKCERGEGRERVPIGRPIGNVRMYVMDERQEVVGVGMRGEMYIGGVGVGRGYYGRGDMSGEKFMPDVYSEEEGSRMYRTGDIGRYRGGGEIEYLGRADNQVKVRGNRVELGEVEGALREHEEVKEAVVMVREEGGGGKRLVGYVVCKGEIGGEELRRHLKQRLPEYMVPSGYVMLEELPLTASGKVDRKALPAAGEAEQVRGEKYEAAGTAAERVLAGIWSKVLRVERVGIHDNFFGLGGDSILSIQVISQIGRAHV